MTRINKRIALMHELHGVTMGERCRGCYHWHMMMLFCEQAPAAKRSKWAGNWAACGRWAKRGWEKHRGEG